MSGNANVPGTPLTERQQEVFDFIRQFVADHGYGPSVQEICDRFEINSKNGVQCHLRALASKGVLRRPVGKIGRSIYRAFEFPEANS